MPGHMNPWEGLHTFASPAEPDRLSAPRQLEPRRKGIAHRRNADECTAISRPHSRTFAGGVLVRKEGSRVQGIPRRCTGIFACTVAQCRGNCPAAVPEVGNGPTRWDWADQKNLGDA